MKLYSILWPFVFLLELVNCYMWDEDYCFFQFLSIRDRENGWLNYNTGFVNLDQSTTLCVLLICLEMDDLYWFSRMGVASCTGGSTYANFSQLKSLVCNFELTTGLLQVWDAWTPGSERPGFTGPTTLGIQEVDIQLTDDAGCKSVGNWLAWQEKYCYFPPILTTYSGPHLAGLQRCICETGGVDYANYWYSRILYERCAGTTLYANLYDMMTKVCVPGVDDDVAYVGSQIFTSYSLRTNEDFLSTLVNFLTETDLARTAPLPSKSPTAASNTNASPTSTARTEQHTTTNTNSQGSATASTPKSSKSKAGARLITPTLFLLYGSFLIF